MVSQEKEHFGVINSEIGEFIRMIRIKKGLTGAELGKLIGVSQQQISRYERGYNTLSLSDFTFILSVMNVSLLDFISYSSFFKSDDCHITPKDYMTMKS
ncbi:helix-turn-helix transcriptional regulator [Providencia stuartii]|nr:helix-turn-helix transcriptional regulator [Providencia stuartii]